MPISRRNALLTLLAGSAAVSLTSTSPAQAAPDGYRIYNDKLDGYQFTYPDTWAAITSSGNDIFLRNPFNIDENLFVDITSPSSSRFNSVEDLGSPEDAAKRLLDQFLTREFMSTRIGIKRQGEVLSATKRTGADGQLYYDINIRMKSFGSRNPYVATNKEVMSEYGLEWDRTLTTVLGVANNRLYNLRLQSSSQTFEQGQAVRRVIMDSFECRKVEEL